MASNIKPLPTFIEPGLPQRIIENNFNKSKSDLKHLESSCLGLPVACQDICTYENAPIKFKTGDEMIDQLKAVLGNERRFIKESVRGRNFAETRFLEKEENIEEPKVEEETGETKEEQELAEPGEDKDDLQDPNDESEEDEVLNIF